MADNTVEIVIRVQASQAQAALDNIKRALSQHGQAASSGAQGMNMITSAFMRFLGPAAAVTAAVVAIKSGFDALKNALTGSVEAIDTAAKTAINLNIELMTLQKGNMSWAQGMEYSRAVVANLADEAAKLGISFQTASQVMKAFASIGVMPQGAKDVQSMMEIAKAASAFGLSRGGGANDQFAIMMQIRQLIDGTTSSMSKLGGVIAKNLGMSQKDLAVWMQHQVETGKTSEMMAKIAGALSGVSKGYVDINALISTQREVLASNLAKVQIMAGGGLYSGVQTALMTINKLLETQGAAIAQVIKPAMDSLGQSIAGFADYLVKNWSSIAEVINIVITGMAQFVQFLQGAVMVANDLYKIIMAVTWPLREISAIMGHLVGGGKGSVPIVPLLGEGLATGGPSKPTTPNIPHIGPLNAPDFAHSAGKDAYTEQKDAIEAAAAHQRAMAESIDDTAKRETRLAAITGEEIVQYKNLLAHTTDATKQAELRLKIEELNVQQLKEQRQAAHDLVTESVAASEGFLAHLKGTGQLSTTDELAGYKRIRAGLSGTIAAGGPGAKDAAAEAKRIDEEIYRLTQELTRQRDEEQKKQVENLKKNLEEESKVWEQQNKQVIEGMKRLNDEMANAFGSAFDNVLDGTQSFVQALVSIFRNVGRDILTSIGHNLGQQIANVLAPVPQNPYANALNQINGIPTGQPGYGGAASAIAATLTGGGGSLLSGGGGGGSPFGGLVSIAKSIFGFAEGGVATRPMVAMAGEAGPEAFVPLRGGKIPVDVGGAGGGTVHIHAVDAESVKSLFYEHGDTLADILAGRSDANSLALRPFSR